MSCMSQAANHQSLEFAPPRSDAAKEKQEADWQKKSVQHEILTGDELISLMDGNAWET